MPAYKLICADNQQPVALILTIA